MANNYCDLTGVLVLITSPQSSPRYLVASSSGSGPFGHFSGEPYEQLDYLSAR